MFEAIPQPTEATAKIATPTTNIRRRPSRSPSEPPTRINAPRNSPYDSTPHCTSTTVARNVAWIAGKATLTTVLSMNAMLEPRMVATRIHTLASGLQGTSPTAVRIEASSQGVLMNAYGCHLGCVRFRRSSEQRLLEVMGAHVDNSLIGL